MARPASTNRPDQGVNVALELIIGALGAVATIVAFIVGRSSGKKEGSKEGLEAASSAESRARDQARAHARDNALMQDNQQRLLELIVNLPETVNMMGAARSTSALCRITVRAMMDLAGARRVGLFIAYGAPPKFRLEVFAGNPRPEKKMSFDLGRGKLGQLAELIGVRSEGDLNIRPDRSSISDADEYFNPDMCVSVRRHDKIYAFVAMDGIERDDPMTRRIVQMLADIHAVSAEGLAILHKERAKADIDQLTGLFNRRHLDRRLAEEMVRSQSYGNALSVFLFDIDNFKHYNDNNGHQAGDECLQQVAALTRKVTRGSDVVCRYGGEEFLVILLGAKRDEALHHAERIRKTIASSFFPAGATQPLGFVSVSGGVATYPDDGANPTEVIALADKALYSAKESGRNRVLTSVDVTGPRSSQEVETLRQEAARPGAIDVPPTFAPLSMQESPLPVYNTQLRAADPVHTPVPQRHSPREEYRGSSQPPMPAHTPLPEFGDGPTPHPRTPGPGSPMPQTPDPQRAMRHDPLTPQSSVPEIRVANPRPEQYLARDTPRDGVYIIRDDPKKVDRTR